VSNAIQGVEKTSSRLTLVLRPSKMIERLITKDFIARLPGRTASAINFQEFSSIQQSVQNGQFLAGLRRLATPF